jgi:hypothetical protein
MDCEVGSGFPGVFAFSEPGNPGTRNPLHNPFLYINKVQWNISIAFYVLFVQS